MKSISKKHILLPYLMIPIGLLVVLVDHFIFHDYLQGILPGDPHSLFVINLLFGLPHVIAGDMQLLDREYLKFHKAALAVCILISLAFPVTLISTMGLTAFIVVEYIIGAFHAGGQQMGIVGMFTEFDRKFFQTWKWSGRVALSLTAFRMVRFEVFGPYFVGRLDYILYLSLFLHLITGLHMMKSCPKRVGQFYIFCNILMTFSFYGFYMIDYPSLSILTLRLPHDITAFLFYINHTTLRNEEETHNWVVRYLRIPKRVGGYFLPLLVVPLAFVIQSWEAVFLVDAFLSFMHFTSESFVWKHTSPAFRFIKVA